MKEKAIDNVTGNVNIVVIEMVGTTVMVVRLVIRVVTVGSVLEMIVGMTEHLDLVRRFPIPRDVQANKKNRK